VRGRLCERRSNRHKQFRPGRHPHYGARWIARPPQAAFVTRLRPVRLPVQAARQLPDQSTTLWAEPSSAGDTRLRGAPKQSQFRPSIRNREFAPNVRKVILGIEFGLRSQSASLQPAPGSAIKLIPFRSRAMSDPSILRRIRSFTRSLTTARPHLPQRDKCAAGVGRPSLGLRPRSVRPTPAHSHPD
jgi:hypothetical protein